MKTPTFLSTTLLLAMPLAFSIQAESSCHCTIEQTSFLSGIPKALSAVAVANSSCLSTNPQFSFKTVAKEATPAVVFIKVEINAPDVDSYGSQDPYSNPFNDEFFRRFFGAPYGRPQTPQPQVGQGSGFLVSADGYIMTNAHVVKGADKIEITLNDGQVQPATLVGLDPHTDLAVVKIDKIDGKDYPFLTLGDSDTLEVGEWVVAIGSPFQLQASVTAGIVSAKGRQGLNITDLEDFIQTDAAINPGNSGGPLLNLEGKVVGINTAIASRSGGYMGIGFAIPSDMAKNVMDQLIHKGSVTRGYLGISLQPVDKEIAAGFNLDKAEGVLISIVEKGTPADKAGLQQGDIILEYNGKPVKSVQTFRYDISMLNPGSQVNLKVNRKGKIITIVATVGSAAEGTSPAAVSQKLGIEISNLTPDYADKLGYSPAEEGVVITKIKPGSPAALAGLRPGFLIQAINHKKVSNVEDYDTAMGEASPNKRILLLVRHGKMTRFYSLRIE